MKSRMQILFTHASFESGFRKKTVLYKIIITVFYYQNTPLLAPLIFLCVLNKHHCSHFYTAPGRSREEVSISLWPGSSSPPFPATSSNVLHLFTIFTITGLCHVVLALQGQQVFSWAIHTYMARHVRYTIFFLNSKLACGIERGGVRGGGVGGTQHVLT